MRWFAHILAACLLFGLTLEAQAQVDQQLLLRAQDDLVLVAWVDSAPELFEQLSEVDLNPLFWIQHELHNDDIEKQLLPLREVVDALILAVEDQVFSDDIVLIVRETESGKWAWSVSASTKFDQSECEAFFSQLDLLLRTGRSISSKWDRQTTQRSDVKQGTSVRTNSDETLLLYHWKLAQETIHIASSNDELERITTSEFKQSTSVIARREFQTIFAKAEYEKLRTSDGSRVGLFIAPRAIDAYLSAFKQRLPRHYTYQENAVLHATIVGSDIRGVGGYIELESPDDALDLTRVSGDFYAIFPQPFKGALSAVTNTRQLPIFSSVDPFESIFRLSVDGEQLLSTVKAEVERLEASSSNQQLPLMLSETLAQKWYPNSGKYSPLDLELAERIDAIGIVRPYRYQSPFFSEPNRMIHVQDSNEVLEQLADIIQIHTNDRTSVIESNLNRSISGKRVRWEFSESTIERQIRFRRRSIEDRISQIEKRLEAFEQGYFHSFTKVYDQSDQPRFERALVYAKQDLKVNESSVRRQFSGSFRLEEDWLLFDSVYDHPNSKNLRLESQQLLKALDSLSSQLPNEGRVALSCGKQIPEDWLIAHSKHWLGNVVATAVSKRMERVIVVAAKDNTGFTIKAAIDQRSVPDENSDDE